MHISQLIDSASHAVSEIKARKGLVMMDIMQSDKFSQEQKIAMVDLLKPLDLAIDNASSKFIVDMGQD
jgi:hypothetical protein